MALRRDLKQAKYAICRASGGPERTAHGLKIVIVFYSRFVTATILICLASFLVA